MASIGWVGDMVGLDKILDIFGGCWMDCGVCEKEEYGMILKLLV